VWELECFSDRFVLPRPAIVHWSLMVVDSSQWSWVWLETWSPRLQTTVDCSMTSRATLAILKCDRQTDTSKSYLPCLLEMPRGKSTDLQVVTSHPSWVCILCGHTTLIGFFIYEKLRSNFVMFLGIGFGCRFTLAMSSLLSRRDEQLHLPILARY